MLLKPVTTRAGTRCASACGTLAAAALLLVASHGASLGAPSREVVNATITAPGANITGTVLELSEADPAVALVALQTALNILGAGSSAAGQLLAAFADDISNIADCDPDAARELSNTLQAVLADPAFAELVLASPSAVALAQEAIATFDVPPVFLTGSGSSAGAGDSAGTSFAPDPGPGTFGSFGSVAGTAAGTSPAS